VLAYLNNNNKNINLQIHLIILILEQQILNLNNFITNFIISNFDKQLKQSLKIENKLNNFLKNKIIFVFILFKTQKLLNAITIRNASCAISLRLQLFIIIVLLLISLFFALLLKRAISSYLYCYRFISLFALLYFFSRSIYTLINL